jgi:hypothetical protein
MSNTDFTTYANKLYKRFTELNAKVCLTGGHANEQQRAPAHLQPHYEAIIQNDMAAVRTAWMALQELFMQLDTEMSGGVAVPLNAQ